MSSAKGRLFRLGLDVINSQETSHTSPSWASYGVSTVKIFENIDGAKTASQCNEHTQQYEFSTHTSKYQQSGFYIEIIRAGVWWKA